MTQDRTQLSVIAPCFNEADNVYQLVERTFRSLDAVGISFELIIVDDASTDQTWSKAHELIEPNDSRLKAVRHKANKGMVGAWKTGLEVACGESICLIDADLQNPPEEIPKMYALLMEKDIDLVRGVRVPSHGNVVSRKIQSRILNSILNRAFRMSSRDNKSGFIVVRRDELTRLLNFKGNYWGFQTFLGVAAHSKGLLVEEIETRFDQRVHGKSFLDGRTLRVSLRTVRDILIARDEFRSTLRHPYTGLRRLLFEVYFLTMPLHAWTIRGRYVRRQYLSLKRREFASSRAIEAVQMKKLQSILHDAAENFPFYTEKLRGVAEEISRLTDIRQIKNLPLLTKDEVRNFLGTGLSPELSPCKKTLKITTSGSTGSPFTIYANRKQLEVRFASTLRALEWTGWRFGDRQLRLWHQKIGMSRLQVFKEKFDAILLRRRFIPAFEFDEGSMHRLVNEIENFRPSLIDGYAESLNFLAHFIKHIGSITSKPKAIMSSAQVLPDDTRRAISETVGAEVFDKYGSREFSGIAYECEYHTGLHVIEECYVIELLVDGREAEPGEIGEIVITDLYNRATPLIRYRIGDLAVAVDNSIPCPCGRRTKRIGQIQGRTQAIVFCANGRWLPGTFFAHFFKEFDEVIRSFQVVQQARGSFDLMIIPGPQFSSNKMNEILGHLSEFVGETDVNVRLVSEIPLLATGKRSPVISNIPVDFQEISQTI